MGAPLGPQGSPCVKLEYSKPYDVSFSCVLVWCIKAILEGWKVIHLGMKRGKPFDKHLPTSLAVLRLEMHGICKCKAWELMMACQMCLFHVCNCLKSLEWA